MLTELLVSFRRTPKLVRQSVPEVYQLTLVLRGSGTLVLGRQEVTCGAYEFHSDDSSRASETWTGREPRHLPQPPAPAGASPARPTSAGLSAARTGGPPSEYRRRTGNSHGA